MFSSLCWSSSEVQRCCRGEAQTRSGHKHLHEPTKLKPAALSEVFWLQMFQRFPDQPVVLAGVSQGSGLVLVWFWSGSGLVLVYSSPCCWQNFWCQSYFRFEGGNTSQWTSRWWVKRSRNETNCQDLVIKTSSWTFKLSAVTVRPGSQLSRPRPHFWKHSGPRNSRGHADGGNAGQRTRGE